MCYKDRILKKILDSYRNQRLTVVQRMEPVRLSQAISASKTYISDIQQDRMCRFENSYFYDEKNQIFLVKLKQLFSIDLFPKQL